MGRLGTFWEIEKAFWKKALKREFNFMAMFVAVMLAITVIIASLNFGLGTFWGWFVLIAGFYGYLVAMPMIMYLIDPKVFFPRDNNQDGDNKIYRVRF